MFGLKKKLLSDHQVLWNPCTYTKSIALIAAIIAAAKSLLATTPLTSSLTSAIFNRSLSIQREEAEEGSKETILFCWNGNSSPCGIVTWCYF